MDRGAATYKTESLNDSPNIKQTWNTHARTQCNLSFCPGCEDSASDEGEEICESCREERTAKEKKTTKKKKNKHKPTCTARTAMLDQA
jgi:hypothetical protein